MRKQPRVFYSGSERVMLRTLSRLYVTCLDNKPENTARAYFLESKSFTSQNIQQLSLLLQTAYRLPVRQVHSQKAGE